MSPTPQQIRAARHAAGLTQAQLAPLMSGTARAVQAYEQGYRCMPPGLWVLLRARLAHRAGDYSGALALLEVASKD